MNRLRLKSRYVYGLLMYRHISEVCFSDLGRNAVVFSPHKDDETLGCGGTILKKKRAGADVTIVFMTDGRLSHSHLISADKLKNIRTSEAISASRMLGVSNGNVVFLEYEEGILAKNMDSAVNKVKEILLLHQPDEVFIPHKREPVMPTTDHKVTNRIVLSALRMCKRKVTVYEYPVWLWHHPPWVSVPMGHGTLNALKQSLFSVPSMVMDFNCSIYIGDVLQLKRAVLDKYKSQMTRLVPNPRWRTLGDFSNGEFLECFFREQEIFHRYFLNV
jgi:LmbE family N-acetylglucosaminyl deacetylase